MIRRLIEKIRSILKKEGIYYVGSADILPPPLDEKEEEKFIIKSMNGDIEARNILIEHNLRLVVFLSKKYDSTGYDLEDLVSIGTIGLIKGVNTYKMDKNIKLATYASRCIDNEILMFLRKNKKSRVEVSLDGIVNLDGEGNELHLEDILGTEEDVVPKKYEEELDKKVLISELDNLNKRDRDIIVMRYGLLNSREYTQKEVADLLNISQSYISRIEKRIIKKLKCLMRVN